MPPTPYPYKPWMLSAMAPQGQLRADEFNALTQRKSSEMRNALAVQQLEDARARSKESAAIERERLSQMAEQFKAKKGWRGEDVAWRTGRATKADARQAAQDLLQEEDRAFQTAQVANPQYAKWIRENPEPLYTPGDFYEPGRQYSPDVLRAGPPKPPVPKTIERRALRDVQGSMRFEEDRLLSEETRKDRATQRQIQEEMNLEERRLRSQYENALGPEKLEQMQIFSRFAVNYPGFGGLHPHQQSALLKDNFPQFFKEIDEWETMAPDQRREAARNTLLEGEFVSKLNWFSSLMRPVNETIAKYGVTKDVVKKLDAIMRRQVLPQMQGWSPREQAALAYAIAEVPYPELVTNPQTGQAQEIPSNPFPLTKMLPALLDKEVGDINKAKQPLMGALGFKWERVKERGTTDTVMYAPRYLLYRFSEEWARHVLRDPKGAERIRRARKGLTDPKGPHGPKVSGGDPTLRDFAGGAAPTPVPQSPRPPVDPRALREAIRQVATEEDYRRGVREIHRKHEEEMFR